MHSVADGSQRDLIWPLGHKYGVWKCLVSPNCTFKSSERVGTMVKLELYMLLVVCSLNIRTILPGVPRHAVLASPYPPPTGLQKMQDEVCNLMSSLARSGSFFSVYQRLEIMV